MENTNVLVDFIITGDDYDINEISTLLKIEPNKYWKKGEAIRHTGKNRTYTGWIFSTGYEETLDINTQLKKIEYLFQDKSDILIELKTKYKLEYCVEIVIKINHNEIPAMYLETEMINFASAIGASFDFDTYINQLTTGKWNKGSFDTLNDSLKWHYNKHGAEVGANSMEQYLRKAEDFSRNLRGAQRYNIDGEVGGVTRYVKNGKYIDVQIHMIFKIKMGRLYSEGKNFY